MNVQKNSSKSDTNFPDINKISYSNPVPATSNVKNASKAKETVVADKWKSANGKTVTKKAPATATGTKRAAAPGSPRTPVKNSAARSVAASDTKKDTARSDTAANAKRVAIEKRRKQERKKIAAEQKRKSRREARGRTMAKISEFFRLLFKDTGPFIKCVIAGVIIAIVVGSVTALLYSRFVVKYDTEFVNRYYEFYSYIDPEEETERADLKRKAREENDESASVLFKQKQIVMNGEAFFPISSLTEFFGLSMSGDDSVRTIRISDSDTDSAVFKAGSRMVEINGSVHTLCNAPIFRNGDVYIPLEFFEKYVRGISFKYTDEWGHTTVGITLEQPTISFIGSSDSILDTPNIRDYVTAADATYTYSFDITPYEQYINPADPNKYLTLVNLDNRLSSDYEPEDLIDVIHTRSTRTKPERMRLDAAKALEAMLKAAALDGINDVSVTSGYREYAYQEQLFNLRLNEKLSSGKYASREAAEAETAKFTMYPGASEHQSGLCADMHNLPSAMQSFSQTEAYNWLYKHCADFGFILRYPENKEGVTGISFEPWHYRFVGRFHAQLIMESGLSLEEYVEAFNASAN